MATWLNQLQAIISHDKNLYLEDHQLADSFFKKVKSGIKSASSIVRRKMNA